MATLKDLPRGTRFRFPGEPDTYAVLDVDHGSGAVKVENQNCVTFAGCVVSTVNGSELVEIEETK